MESSTKPESGVSELFNQVKSYADTSIDLLKLKSVNKITDASASILAKLLVGGIFVIAITLLSVGLSIYLGKLLGAVEYGFFAVGGIATIVGGILYALRNKLVKPPIAASFIKKALK